MTSPGQHDDPELRMVISGGDLGPVPDGGWGIGVLVHVECGHAIAMSQAHVVERAAAALAERAAASGRTGTVRWKARAVADTSDDPALDGLFARRDCATCRRDRYPALTAIRHAMRRLSR